METIRDLLHSVYRLMDAKRKFIAEKEYPGKEIDTAYFNGMDDGIKEVFGRLHLHNLLDLPLDLPLVVAEEIARIATSAKEEDDEYDNRRYDGRDVGIVTEAQKE